MRFQETDLAGAFRVELSPHVDERGFFARAFCEDEFAAHGLPTRFPQCNLSRNTRAGTFRGMHYNLAAHRESKLVRCTSGAIWDAIIDLRPGSSTRLRWLAVELSAERGDALFVPAGFAHGFVTLREGTDVLYMMDRSHVPDAARGLRWNDPRFGIPWPLTPVVISERDRTWADFDETSFDG
jgi:dTDP-4-dehydrorhamnose 3,5-epimerase